MSPPDRDVPFFAHGSALAQGASRMAHSAQGLPGIAASFAGLSRLSRWWFIKRPLRTEEEADPLSAFDRDPDDGPESEGLMHYGN